MITCCIFLGVTAWARYSSLLAEIIVIPEVVSMHNRDALISEFQNYVRSIALRLIRSLNLPAQNLDEYIAAGYLGLVEAAERFDGRDGRPFKPFAFLRIRGAIIDSIRITSHVSSKAYRMSKALQSAQELKEEMKIAHANSFNTNVKAKAVENQAKLARILEYAAQGILVFRLSLTEVAGEVSAIADERANPEEMAVANSNLQNMLDLVETLPQKERTIIKEHYYHGKSFIEIADEQQGMSKSWVSRLHSRALQRLKEKYLQSVKKNLCEAA